ncbi:hypothetical protein QFZ80_002818 [Paenibacillus sp. V4I7]|nr:hypothetical protein [Paenibacillus sp. V4I7]
MKSPTIVRKSHKDAIGLTANGVFASGELGSENFFQIVLRL